MNEELCKKEIEMMKRAGKHANLVSLIDVVELPDARALVLELATGGEVFERICEKGCYSEKDAALVAKQVALALKHLHGRGIAHRDLKLENIVLDARGYAKLVDLGAHLRHLLPALGVLRVVLRCEAPLVGGEDGARFEHLEDLSVHALALGRVAGGLDGVHAVAATPTGPRPLTTHTNAGGGGGRGPL